MLSEYVRREAKSPLLLRKRDTQNKLLNIAYGLKKRLFKKRIRNAKSVRLKFKKYPSVTVDAVIIENERILLVKRKYDPFKNYWALPGGFIELGETVEAACIREVKEETNLDVEFKSFFGAYSNPKRDPRGHVITVVCFCKKINENQFPMGSDDAKEAKFIGKSELNKIKDRIAFDHLQIMTDSGFFQL